MRAHGFRPGTATVMDPGLVPRSLLRLVTPLIRARSVSGEFGGALGVSAFPAWIRPWGTRQMLPTAVAGPECTGCGFCSDHCPVDAITVIDRRARMDVTKCIWCYCCHELCPHLAVELRRPLLGRLLFSE